MKNCGRRFHNEVGKYRFLNELIKVVSPKVSISNVHLGFMLHRKNSNGFFYSLMSGCLVLVYG